LIYWEVVEAEAGDKAVKEVTLGTASVKDYYIITEGTKQTLLEGFHM